MATSSPPMAFFLLLLFIFTTSASAGFNCKATGHAATCRSLVGFQTFNATTYGAVQALFEVPSLAALLGANGLPISTLPSAAVASNSTVLVPIPCRCVNGTGRSDRTPVYTIQFGDILYNIAYFSFGSLLKYEEIASVNNLSNPDNILLGQKLWIPLPCSCDAVGAESAVHLAHRVAAGSSLEGIASQFGTDESTLMALNGIDDPKNLKADQILDVPLQACSSSISNTSSDYNYMMRLANDSFALTANGCVQCSCSSSNSYQLECHQIISNSMKCEVSTCQGNLSIGNTTTSSSSCEQTTCAYAGFTNTSSSTVDVKTIAVNQTTCKSDGSPLQESKGFMWTMLLIFLNAILFSLM